MTRVRTMILLVIVGLVQPASAQLQMTGVGPGRDGLPLGACGTGVIDFSTGCTQPMLRGL